MSKIGVAVIGTGGWGKNHVRAYSELKYKCELKAVCDLDSSKAKDFAQKFHCDAYTDVKQLFKRRDIEAVSVCTPPATHFHIAREALSKKKNLLIEKPMTTTIREGVELYRIAMKTETKVTVGFIERYNQGLRRLKDVVQRGDIGVVRYLTAGRISKYSTALGKTGVILDAAIHDIDAIRFVLEEDPVRVYAEAQNNIPEHPKELETSSEIFFSFSGGKSAHLITEWLSPEGKTSKRIRQIQVTGSDGTVVLSYLPQLVWKIDAVDVHSPFVNEHGKPNYSRDPRDTALIEPTVWQEPLKNELSSFIDCVVNDEEPLVSIVDGVRVLEIALAAVESARNGMPQVIKYHKLPT